MRNTVVEVNKLRKVYGDLIAVDDDSALHIKNTFNMIEYIKTSAKSGYNIEQPFEILTKKLIEVSKY